MVRYDSNMREKCRQAALAQHNSMSSEQKQLRIENIKEGRKKAVLEGKRPGNFVPHTEEAKLKISLSHKGTIPWNKDKRCVQRCSDKTRLLKSKVSKELWNNMSEQQKEIRNTKIREKRSKYIKDIGGPRIGKQEIYILDLLENYFNYKIVRQYNVKGYFIDGYCPALKLAIEIDEPYHNNKQKNIRDLKRESLIKNELKCSFLRLKI